MKTAIPEAIAVYGDELLEKGHPLGEMIALARKGDEASDDELWNRIPKYNREHFSDVLTMWRHGVVDTVRVTTADGAAAAKQMTGRDPALRFVRACELDVPNVEVGNTDPMPILLQGGLPESLRELKLWLREENADFSMLYAQLPPIERLSLWEPKVLGSMELPNLTWLQTVHFRAKTNAELAKAKLPRLETLEVHAYSWVELAGLDLSRAPNLHTLAMGYPPEPRWRSDRPRDTPVEDCAALFDAPVARQAKRLHFVSTLSNGIEAALMRCVPALARYDEVKMVKPRHELRQALTTALGDRLGFIEPVKLKLEHDL